MWSWQSIITLANTIYIQMGHFACVCFLACQVWFDYASLWFKGRPENQGSKVLQGTENAGKNKSIILAMSNPLLYM